MLSIRKVIVCLHFLAPNIILSFLLLGKHTHQFRVVLFFTWLGSIDIYIGNVFFPFNAMEGIYQLAKIRMHREFGLEMSILLEGAATCTYMVDGFASDLPLLAPNPAGSLSETMSSLCPVVLVSLNLEMVEMKMGDGSTYETWDEFLVQETDEVATDIFHMPELATTMPL